MTFHCLKGKRISTANPRRTQKRCIMINKSIHLNGLLCIEMGYLHTLRAQSYWRSSTGHPHPFWLNQYLDSEDCHQSVPFPKVISALSFNNKGLMIRQKSALFWFVYLVFFCCFTFFCSAFCHYDKNASNNHLEKRGGCIGMSVHGQLASLSLVAPHTMMEWRTSCYCIRDVKSS